MRVNCCGIVKEILSDHSRFLGWFKKFNGKSHCLLFILLPPSKNTFLMKEGKLLFFPVMRWLWKGLGKRSSDGDESCFVWGFALVSWVNLY